MAKDTTFAFRPQNKVVDFWKILRKLCKDRNISVSELWNSIIPPIVAELAKQPPNYPSVYEFNLGMIRVDTMPISHAKD